MEATFAGALTQAGLRPALGRAYVMSRTVREIQSHLREQLHHERTFDYANLSHTLPPSLRPDYVPDKYYNAPTLAKMKEMQEEGAPDASAASAEKPIDVPTRAEPVEIT